MQEDLIKMRQASAQVMASQKQMEAKYKQAQSTAVRWDRGKMGARGVGRAGDEGGNPPFCSGERGMHH